MKRNVLHGHSLKKTTAYILLTAVIIMAIICLFVGSSGMTVSDCFAALAKKSTAANNRIIWNIRVPRVLAAIIAGAGLSVSGLVMQTNLNNPMGLAFDARRIQCRSVRRESFYYSFRRRLSFYRQQCRKLCRRGEPVCHLGHGVYILYAFYPADPRPVPDAFILSECCGTGRYRGRRGLDCRDDRAAVLRDRCRHFRCCHMELRRPWPCDI